MSYRFDYDATSGLLQGSLAGRVTSEHNDVASTSLLETWIDEAERRVWFLFEATRRA